MAEDEMKADIELFKRSVNDRLDGVQRELRELTKALRELIRIDGDIKRVQDAMMRIGRQVDDHEERIRQVENSGTVNTTKISNGERIVWIVIMFALGLIQYELTR